jgi:hypothetical protein
VAPGATISVYARAVIACAAETNSSTNDPMLHIMFGRVPLM